MLELKEHFRARLQSKAAKAAEDPLCIGEQVRIGLRHLCAVGLDVGDAFSRRPLYRAQERFRKRAGRLGVSQERQPFAQREARGVGFGYFFWPFLLTDCGVFPLLSATITQARSGLWGQNVEEMQRKAGGGLFLHDGGGLGAVNGRPQPLFPAADQAGFDDFHARERLNVHGAFCSQRKRCNGDIGGGQIQTGQRRLKVGVQAIRHEGARGDDVGDPFRAPRVGSRRQEHNGAVSHRSM